MKTAKIYRVRMEILDSCSGNKEGWAIVGHYETLEEAIKEAGKEQAKRSRIDTGRYEIDEIELGTETKHCDWLRSVGTEYGMTPTKTKVVESKEKTI